MTLEGALGLGQQALLTAATVAAPLLALVFLASLAFAALQAALGLGDPALAVLPRLAVAAAGLAALGPWMGRELVALAARAFSGVP